MTSTSNFKLSMAAIAASLLVAACGGGGGDSGASPSTPASGTSTPSSNAPSTDVAPSTTIPTATYASSTFQASAFTGLNNYRAAMGVGTLKQDPILDTASAQAHALYLSSNLRAHTISAFDHNEIAANANYYADTPLARAQKAGTPTTEYIGEVIAGNASQVTAAAEKTSCIGRLLASVYHLVNLTYGEETVGMGYMPGDRRCSCTRAWRTLGPQPASAVPPGPNSNPTWGGQQLATNMVVHSPISNETGVRTAMAPEAPNPASDVSAPGRPIMVRVNAEKGNARVCSCKIHSDRQQRSERGRAHSGAIGRRQATSTASTADPNNLLPNGTAVLLPLAPLQCQHHLYRDVQRCAGRCRTAGNELDLHDRRKLITHRFPDAVRSAPLGAFLLCRHRSYRWPLVLGTAAVLRNRVCSDKSHLYNAVAIRIYPADRGVIALRTEASRVSGATPIYGVALA